MLAFESLTPEALLKEIAEFLHHRAWQEGACADPRLAKTISARKLAEARSNVLKLTAQELDSAAILPADSKLREKPKTPVANAPSADAILREFVGDIEAVGTPHTPQDVIRALVDAIRGGDETAGFTMDDALADADAYLEWAESHPEPSPEKTFTAVANALAVIVLDHRIREYLELHDPKAFAQAERALVAYDMNYAAKLRDARTIAATNDVAELAEANAKTSTASDLLNQIEDILVNKYGEDGEPYSAEELKTILDAVVQVFDAQN